MSSHLWDLLTGVRDVAPRTIQCWSQARAIVEFAPQRLSAAPHTPKPAFLHHQPASLLHD